MLSYFGRNTCPICKREISFRATRCYTKECNDLINGAMDPSPQLKTEITESKSIVSSSIGSYGIIDKLLDDNKSLDNKLQQVNKALNQALDSIVLMTESRFGQNSISINKNILIIGKDKFFNECIHDALSKYCQAELAESSTEAIDLIKYNHFACILITSVKDFDSNTLMQLFNIVKETDQNTICVIFTYYYITPSDCQMLKKMNIEYLPKVGDSKFLILSILDAIAKYASLTSNKTSEITSNYVDIFPLKNILYRIRS